MSSSAKYQDLCKKISKMSISDSELIEVFPELHTFVENPAKAIEFLKMNTVKMENTVTYQTTLMGLVMSVSSLPRPASGSSVLEFFQNTTRQDPTVENFIGMRLDYISQEIHKMFHNLLKMQETRNYFLTWLGRCVFQFNDRKKLWSNQLLMSRGSLSVNDGFLMNLLNVMLRLSEPFTGPYLDTVSCRILGSYSPNNKLLKIDPRYCKWSKVTPANYSSTEFCTHFLGLSEDTTLIDVPSNDNSETCPEFKFITECFFGTHVVFSYAFRSIYERFFKLAQNINDLQHILIEAGPSTDLVTEKISQAMGQFLNLKAILMVPQFMTMGLHFCASTASYLNHLVACQNLEDALNSTDFKKISTMDNLNGSCIKYLPEMLVENMVDFLLFLKNFNEQFLINAAGLTEPIMTTIIVFMGNPSLMKNPHLRARFAEILECLMPHEIFDMHPLKRELVSSLVNVFVSIEMTGEGGGGAVQFEQKFSYRRPMYSVLEYLWSKDIHKNSLKRLANEAERNIESAKQPLFLRFINLLMNDAIFLLDEALGYMKQLRETEIQKQTWATLQPQQRAAAESSYNHIGRLAKFHNVLSLSTIGTLAWITSDIKTIFCHPTLVDRIANMLNYFLEHLSGRKKDKLKVISKNDYEFRPKEILEKICQIYVHLGSESNPKFHEFCTAVSSDGRSYSDNLLPQATEILYRTGKSSLGMEFEVLSEKIHKIAEQNKIDEIPVEDIPDEFLDPIMSTLMFDPVLLPSSQIIVDRSTIARHLLSDQTDPFNRSSLSMEQVQPAIELKSKIESFLKSRSSNKTTTQ